LVFLIVLITATAVLLFWLLFALGRLALGGLLFPRLRPSPSHGPVSTAASAGTVPRSESAPVRSDTDEDVVYDEADAERVVRERLYGRRGGGRA
jgi:hypothetical protein